MSLYAPETAETLFGPQAQGLVQTATGLGQLGWDAANGAAHNVIAPFNPEYAREAYGENLERLDLTLVNLTGGENIGAAEQGTYTLTQVLLPGAIAKSAQTARLQVLAKNGRVAEGAEAARLQAALVKEANTQHAAVEAGKTAKTFSQTTIDDVATANITGHSTPTACAPNRANYVVSLMGKNGVKYYDNPSATLWCKWRYGVDRPG